MLIGRNGNFYGTTDGTGAKGGHGLRNHSSRHVEYTVLFPNELRYGNGAQRILRVSIIVPIASIPRVFFRREGRSGYP